MSIRRSLLEALVFICSRLSLSDALPSLRRIFVLRNNDIGDVIVITPLFEALRNSFPEAEIVAGVGAWSVPVLLHNPNIDHVVEINAPWHNKVTARYAQGSLRSFANSIRYILGSAEVKELRNMRCTVGIDVLGSPEGSLLMLRAGIPYRVGVKGYAGGHSACQRCVVYEPDLRVGAAAQRVVTELGGEGVSAIKPQLFLSSAERAQATSVWEPKKGKRIVLAPGGGFAEKCRAVSDFARLAWMLRETYPDCELLLIGNQKDREKASTERWPELNNLAGKNSLRETFALLEAADLVVCNSSMVMHAAAAFDVPCVVLLGSYFSSSAAHGKQWNHSDKAILAGPEVGLDEIYMKITGLLA